MPSIMSSIFKAIFFLNIIDFNNVYATGHSLGKTASFGHSSSSFGHSCGILIPILDSECPPNIWSINNPALLPNCNNINIGELCEGDGECGTSHFLNNCECGIFQCDVYKKISFTSNNISYFPTDSPSDLPSYYPTDSPSDLPSDSPSDSPSDLPSDFPTDLPSDFPTDLPSDSPSDLPSYYPTDSPSDLPSDSPSDSPSDLPSDFPTDLPSDFPTDLPSDLPSYYPTDSPITDPCQIIDPLILCPFQTTFDNCTDIITRALCPYICSGCVSVSIRNTTAIPLVTGSISLINQTVSKNVNNINQTNDSKSIMLIVLITGSSLLLLGILLLVIIKLCQTKNKVIRYEAETQKLSNCIENTTYVGVVLEDPNYMYLPQTDFSCDNLNQPTYEVTEEHRYLQPTKTLYDDLHP
jgi:hypothetical protein